MEQHEERTDDDEEQDIAEKEIHHRDYKGPAQENLPGRTFKAEEFWELYKQPRRKPHSVLFPREKTKDKI